MQALAQIDFVAQAPVQGCPIMLVALYDSLPWFLFHSDSLTKQPDTLIWLASLITEDDLEALVCPNIILREFFATRGLYRFYTQGTQVVDFRVAKKTEHHGIYLPTLSTYKDSEEWLGFWQSLPTAVFKGFKKIPSVLG